MESNSRVPLHCVVAEIREASYKRRWL